MAEQRELISIRKCLIMMMEAAGLPMDAHTRMDDILGQVARQAGVQPNDLVLYEDGEKIRVGARPQRSDEYVDVSRLVARDDALNAKPNVIKDPFAGRRTTSD